MRKFYALFAILVLALLHFVIMEPVFLWLLEQPLRTCEIVWVGNDFMCFCQNLAVSMTRLLERMAYFTAPYAGIVLALALIKRIKSIAVATTFYCLFVFLLFMRDL